MIRPFYVEESMADSKYDGYVVRFKNGKKISFKPKEVDKQPAEEYDGGDLRNALKEKYSRTRRKTLRISAKEAAMVEHELNTHYHARYEGKKRVKTPIGSYLYTIEIGGFANYRIIDKERIPDLYGQFSKKRKK